MIDDKKKLEKIKGELRERAMIPSEDVYLPRSVMLSQSTVELADIIGRVGLNASVSSEVLGGHHVILVVTSTVEGKQFVVENIPFFNGFSVYPFLPDERVERVDVPLFKLKVILQHINNGQLEYACRKLAELC